MNKNKILAIALLALVSSGNIKAQTVGGGNIHGNFQADMQYYRKDSAIGASNVPAKTGMNLYGNLVYTNENFTAGLRYESYAPPLLGYPAGYTGSGIPYRYVSYNVDGLDITLGNFYDQFGNGLIFRTYEEKALGIDNAMDGVRVKYSPIKGLYIKGIYGRQRLYFSDGPGIVRGGDAELQLNEVISTIANAKTRITIGASGVSKYEQNSDPIYNYPENVAAGSGRVNINRGGFNINGEVAYKANDPYPSITGQNIFKSGNAYMITTSYSQKGFGMLLGTKRLDNMYFLSSRTANTSLNELSMNFLPPIAKQNTYQLLTIYPYATQPAGEMGYQGELYYAFKPGSPLGGEYGTNIAFNASMAYSIDTTIKYNDERGYKSNPFKPGNDVYYKEFNIEFTKKLTKNLKAVFTYVNLTYNIVAVQGHVNTQLLQGGYVSGLIYANTGIIDITYKITPTRTIRGELQGLFTKQDMGNWGMGLLEYTIAPHWFVATYDLYNYGNPDKDKQSHYFNVAAGFTKNANRIALSYGRQRAGLLCVGGVCRPVPASNGLALSISSSF